MFEQQTTHKSFRRSVSTSTTKHPAARVQHTRSVLLSFSPSLLSSVTFSVSLLGNTDSHHCGLYVIYASTPFFFKHDQRVPHRTLREERGRRDGDLDGFVLARGSEVNGDGEVHVQRGRATMQRSWLTYSGWIVASAINTMS